LTGSGPTTLLGVEALLSFAAALISLRLAGSLVKRLRETRRPELVAWAGSLLAYALASAALAWGAAHGWDTRAFRVYYLFGGMLTAPLLGAGSLLLSGRRWAAPLALLYTGLAIGIAASVPVHGAFAGGGIPKAQAHLELVPARIAAIAGNVLGTLAVVAVALLTMRRRPRGNALLLVGIGLAALGSALAGLGEAETAAFVAAASVFLYLGFIGRSSDTRARLNRSDFVQVPHKP
jgi:hypothetical protein